MDIIASVRIGMTRSEVVSLLGHPDDVSILSRKERVPEIYKNGEIELYFEPGSAGKLWMVYTEVETPEGGRRGITLLK